MSHPTMPRLRFFESAANQRHVLGQDRYLYRQPEPDYNLVVIGTGTIGQEHMRAASLLGRCRIHGIFDSKASSMEAAEVQFQTYSKDRLVKYHSLADACRDQDADALLICTPNYTHHQIFTTAIASGKPLFVEKPMATTLADAASMVRLAQAHDSFVQIGLQYRYKAQYIEAFQEALGRASLGTLKTIAMSEYRPPFLDKVEQWNKFSCYSGGTLVEKCCHYFDLIQLLARSRPVSVFASGGQAVNFLDFEKNGKKSDIDDHAFVVIDYQNGVRANFILNMFSPDFNEELIVCGDKGRLVARERFSFLEQQPAQFSIEVELGETGASRQTRLAYPRLIEQSGHHGATFFEHMALADQLAGLPADCATPLQGLVSIVIATAAQQSMASGEAVSVDAVIRDNNLGDLLTEQAWSY